MRIELGALQSEIPAIAGMELKTLCERLAMIGFPVDAVETQNGVTVLEVDVTANRGDALSHRGLARDLAAAMGAPLAPLPSVPSAEGEALLPVRLEADACPIYATAMLKIDNSRANQTPESAAAFLAAMGSNAKGMAAVDASNELLHRYGHPTHAFDADKIKGGVCVRWAKKGETLLTLDGVNRVLDTKDMVIADDSGPIALAGVIGGDSTKVVESTKRVFLESAYFDPRTVRAAARRHGVQTDASSRFGRGADIAFARAARDIYADRLVSWAGAELLASWTIGQCKQRDMEPPGAFLSKKILDRIAGEPIQLDEAKSILISLGCLVESNDDELIVRPPSWRHDLRIAEDYSEEILRIRGYDKIGATLPPMTGAPEPQPLSYQQRRVLSRRLTQLGFYQTVTLGFTSPDIDAKYADTPPEGRTLVNPLGIEYSVMRASILPSLFDAAEVNLRHGAKDVRLFEIAPVYESSLDGPDETSALAMVWAGTIGGEDPLTPARSVIVADLIAVARDLGFTGDADIIEPGQGLFGLEIPLSAFSGIEEVIPAFKPFSRYPMATRDISLLVPLNLSYGVLEASVRSALGSAPLLSVKCVDVFKDNKLTAEGKQAWLVRMRFQSFDRTLTGGEVESWVQAAITAAKQHGGVLRG
ncbi:MAG: phenylalanine--tRNA ligase subunit beta [Holophagales bacterium]|jgi:phenylalanyl-tRNA synthetase beta chain|nr:phenylalanine--tRNA ligase subunit beta [Holophagales bacterium]